jgi:uncharacterized protein (DUF302 family)
MKFIFLVTSFCFLLTGCEKSSDNLNMSEELIANDKVLAHVESNADDANINYLFSIDHSRLAQQSGETLDASKVLLFSNPLINSRLLKKNIRAGLDLPYRVQAFYHNGQSNIVYTDAEFLRRRHNLGNSPEIALFNDDLQQLVRGLTNAESVVSSKVDRDYGIEELSSSLNFENTISSLKSTIMAEGDTLWFYTLDYQKEAQEFDISLPKATLLVFGAPAPGAAAMGDYPSIGLDAFGQKVLVYEQFPTKAGSSEIKVIYNDIPAFAELHYQSNAVAHKVIKFRLKQTLSSAM